VHAPPWSPNIDVFERDNRLIARLDLPGTKKEEVKVEVAVGFFEELGWTGFATPRLRLRHGFLATGLIVGVPWGAWHLLTNNI
jgi:hypothetical protein